MKGWLFGVTTALTLICTYANAQLRNDISMGKLTHSLVVLHQQYNAHLALGNAVSFKPDQPLLNVIDNRVVIDATASDWVEHLRSDLVFLGMQEAVAAGRIVSGQLPISSLEAAARLPSLKFAQPAFALTHVGSVASQGDLAMRSNVARTAFGLDGTGIRVGVLSDSFNCRGGAAADIASGDLTAVTVIQEIASCIGATDEGRAMLQIVRDVTPGSSLAFATAFNGLASFANNIIALKDNGAKVIVDDVIYFAEPMFQDGIIAQAVNSVVAAGVAYFSAAGNNGRNGYESGFRAGPGFASGAIPSAAGAPPFAGGTAHDFDAGAGSDPFQRITLPSGGSFIMSFQWGSPAFSVSGPPGSQNNLDVYVLNASATQVIGGSSFDNLGRDPIEVFSFTNTTGATADFNIMIMKNTGADPGLMKYVLFNFRGILQEFATNSGTLYGHANAIGAQAVGAAQYSNTPAFGVSPPILEPFSSAGNTPILFDLAGNPVSDPRSTKPEIVAPDGANTTFFQLGVDPEGDGFPNFFGTSAAAPHAAAVAALILQARPLLSPFQVYARLENTAVDMATPGFDNDSGFGLIQADAALAISPEGLGNISTRGPVRTGDNVMIGGFVIEGSVAKTVLISARGPSMGGAPFFLQGTLSNPLLRIFSGSTNVAQNDNWETTDPLCASIGFVCGGPAEIAATGLDPCNSNPGQSISPPGCERESAILITLPPAAYTAIVSGVGGETGIGLVEIYEVDGGASPSKLINFSTRGSVETTDNVMIGGLIIVGNAPKTVLIRGRGPSMGGAPFFVPGSLANPFLRLFSGSTVIAQNDNWGTSDPLCGNMGLICGGAVEMTASGLDPCQPNPGQSTAPAGCAEESSILITLPPGAYTAIVNGVGGTTGIGLVEAFKMN
jgi:Subtilase family